MSIPSDMLSGGKTSFMGIKKICRISESRYQQPKHWPSANLHTDIINIKVSVGLSNGIKSILKYKKAKIAAISIALCFLYGKGFL